MKPVPTVYLDGLSRALCIRPIPATYQPQLSSALITHSRCASTSSNPPKNTQTARFLAENPNKPSSLHSKRKKPKPPTFILPTVLPTTPAPPLQINRDPTLEDPDQPSPTLKASAYNPDAPLAHIRFLLSQLLYPNIFVEAQKVVEVHGHTPTVELYELLLEACARFPIKRLGKDEGSIKVTMLPMAWRLLQECKARGMTPSTVMFHHMLRILSESPDWIKRHAILTEMKDRWYTLTPEAEMWVLEGYFASEQYEEGLATLWRLRKEGIEVPPETVEKILLRLCHAQEADEIVSIIKDKELVRREISLEVWESCLDTAVSTYNGPATAYIFSQITLPTFCPNFTPSAPLLHSILRLCSRTGYPTIASRCLDLLSTLHSQPPTATTHSYLFSSLLTTRRFSPAFITLNTMLSTHPPTHLTPEVLSYTTSKLAAMGKSTLSVIKDILLTHQRKFLLTSIYPLNFLLLAYSNLPRRALKHTFHFYKSISADFNIRPDHNTFLILFLTASYKIHKPHLASSPQPELTQRQVASLQQSLRFCRYLYAEMLATKGVWVSPDIWTLVVGIFVREGELVDVVRVLRGLEGWNRKRVEGRGWAFKKVGLTDALGRRLARLVREYEDGVGEELPEELMREVEVEGRQEVKERELEEVEGESLELDVDVDVKGEERGKSEREEMVEVPVEETIEQKRERRKGTLGWIWGLVERKETIEIDGGEFGQLVKY